MPSHGKLGLSVALCCVMFFATNVFGQDGSPTGKCGFQTLTIPSPAGTTTMPAALNDTGAIVGNLQSRADLFYALWTVILYPVHS
jgi:hypothetical protein